MRGAAEPGNDEGRFLDLYLDSDAEDAEERTGADEDREDDNAEVEVEGE